jgi:hypothetical protein
VPGVAGGQDDGGSRRRAVQDDRLSLCRAVATDCLLRNQSSLDRQSRFRSVPFGPADWIVSGDGALAIGESSESK